MLQIFKKLYRMSGNDKKQINIAFLLQFVDTFLSFVPLGAALLLYEHYINDTMTDSLPLQLFGMLAGSVFIRCFVRYVIDKNQFTTVYSIFFNERIKVADHLKKINMGFFTDDNVGSITTTLVNGISFMEEQCMNSLITALASIVNLIMIAIMLFVMDPFLGFIFVSTLLVIGAILMPYQRKSVVASTKHNMANELLTSAIIEYVKNISVIKSFHLLGKHERSNQAFITRRKIDLDSEKLNIPYIIGSMCLMAISVGLMIYHTTSTVGQDLLYNVIILLIFSLYVFRHMEVVVLKIGVINIANDSLKQLEELYEQKALEVNANETPKTFDIEFKDVEFAYEEKNVINGISFHLKANTMNALVGLSGSGKSTLVNLVPRFYDIQKGSIKIGGVDVRNMSQETLYGCISMVFQNVYLFKDTIYNNIVFGNESATKEQVIDACKKARCYDFIMSLEEGFETEVGEAGLTLSGGERQRISIARAILKNAPIILLDEATASVDPDNELEIQEAINALVEDKTLLVIAHKLSCVKNADQILVIENGELIESGNHKTLLEDNGKYASLWEKRTHAKSWKIVNL